MEKRKISIAVMQPTVVNVSNAVDVLLKEACPDIDCGVYDEGSSLRSGEDRQNAIVPDQVLKVASLRSKLDSIERGMDTEQGVILPVMDKTTDL